MTEELLKAILITSLAGSVFALVITLIKPITKKIFGYKWHYYIWLAVLVVMILPVRFTLPKTDVSQMPVINTAEVYTVQESQAVIEDDTQDNPYTPKATYQKTHIKNGARFISGLVQNRVNILFWVWLLGVLAMLSKNMVGYLRLLYRIRKKSVIIPCSEICKYTKRKVTVRTCKNLSSPFIFGVFKPNLVLPDIELTDEQLDNILRHEMTHLKRHDLLYKWFCALVKALHWFNPFSYYITKQIGVECEISCDLDVVKDMDSAQQMSYVNTIISLLSVNKGKSVPYTTGMTGNKKMLKRRFTMIKNKKNTGKFVSLLSVVLAVVMLCTTVFASGVLSGMGEDEYRIEIIGIDGNVIELNNKPFTANGQVYVPLREMIGKVGYTDETSSIEWKDGTVDITLINYPADNARWRIRIGSPMLSFRRFQGNQDINYQLTTDEYISIVSIKKNDAPMLLENSTTYIPLEQFNYMVYAFTNKRDPETKRLYEITYKISDDDGMVNNDTDFAANASDRITKSISEYYKNNQPSNNGELKIFLYKPFDDDKYLVLAEKYKGEGHLFKDLFLLDSQYNVLAFSDVQAPISPCFSLGQVFYDGKTILFGWIDDSKYIPMEDKAVHVETNEVFAELVSGQSIKANAYTNTGFIEVLEGESKVKSFDLYNDKHELQATLEDGYVMEQEWYFVQE